MKERPILFSAPMVKAILEGRKTQTRRIVKPQPELDAKVGFIHTDRKGKRWASGIGFDHAGTVRNFVHRCPYAKASGERLWVRETWRIGAWDEDEGQISVDYRDGPDKQWRSDDRDDTGEKFNDLWLSCCDELQEKDIRPNRNGRYEWKPGESPLRWRPSIHMPRWASRINLEVTGVRVERLQESSCRDAWAEGIKQETADTIENLSKSPQDIYRELWESINGAGSWARNEWVWVVEFKRVTP